MICSVFFTIKKSTLPSEQILLTYFFMHYKHFPCGHQSVRINIDKNNRKNRR